MPGELVAHAPHAEPGRVTHETGVTRQCRLRTLRAAWPFLDASVRGLGYAGNVVVLSDPLDRVDVRSDDSSC